MRGRSTFGKRPRSTITLPPGRESAYVLVVVIPPPLAPGARLSVVAPSSPFEVNAVRDGIAWLEQRYRVTWSSDLFERRAGFLAGSDAARLEELQQALDAPDVAAVVLARGGYGLTRIVERLDWTGISRRPRWLVGFSDATVLHCEAAARNIASLHASNVAGLGRASAEERARWVRALESPEAPRQWTDLVTWKPGNAEGPLFGGNLTLLFTLAASRRLEVPEGCLLFLEDVSELSYRVDRMLTALHAGGYLERAAGVLLGDFTDCAPGKYAVPIEEVLRERLEALGVPVLAGLPVGHGERNDPLPLGQVARMEAPVGMAGRLLIGG